MTSFRFHLLPIGACIVLNACTRVTPTQTVQKPKHLPTDSLSLPSDTIYTPHAPVRMTRGITRNEKGNLIFASFTSVLTYTDNSFSALPIPPERTNLAAFDILQSESGAYWIASTHHGVYRLNDNGFTSFTVNEGLASNRAMDIMEDHNGTIWATTNGGLSYFDGLRFHTIDTSDGLPHNDISIIMEDSEGTLWLGSRGTVSRYNPSTKRVIPFTPENGDELINIWAIHEDRNGVIWLGGEYGLWRYLPNGQLHKLTDEFTNGLYEDGLGVMWSISPNSALSQYTPSTNHTVSVERREIYRGYGMFFSLYGDAEGVIWVGKGDGVFSYDGQGITYYKDPQPTVQ